MNEMGIYEIRNKAIGELSGGQIQRTLLCRALVNQPKLLVLDEPNTYVDNRLRESSTKSCAGSTRTSPSCWSPTTSGPSPPM